MTQMLAILGTAVLFAAAGLLQVLRRGCPGPDRCELAECGACHLKDRSDET